MITTSGKTHIKRYLAGFVPSIAQSIAFGVGGKAEAAGDTGLQFEVSRADITLISYDFINDKLVFKASIPDDYEGKIYEVALFSLPSSSAYSYGSKAISTFDSDTESWMTAGVAGNFTITNARIGNDSLNLAPAASATATSTLDNVYVDLSQNSAADLLSLAFNANANVASVSVKFKTDTSNYYTITFSNPATGYNVSTVTKGSAVATGTPDWANITSLDVSVTAKSAGAASVDFDGIRIEDTDSSDVDYVMVSRELLATPFTKQPGMSQDIEFSLAVSV